MEEPGKRTIDKTAAMLLRNCILRNKLYATDEETAEWLKTETGQRIAALINERRKEDAK